MTLDGLLVPIWIGWYSGIIYIKPTHWNTSIPKFKPSSILIPLTLTFISGFVWLDFLLSVKIPNDHTNLIRQVVTSGLTWASILFKFFLRVILCFNIKSLISFYLRLNSHNSFLINSANKKAVRWGTPESQSQQPTQLIDQILLYSILTLEILSAILIITGITPRRHLYLTNSWFDFLSDWQYTFLLLIFGISPNFLLVYIVFAIILITTKYLLFIWHDFYSSVQIIVQSLKNSTAGEIIKPHGLYFGIYEYELAAGSMIHTNNDRFNANSIKIQQILKKFDEIVEICNEYNTTIGKLLLGIVCINIVVLIQRINDVFTESINLLAFDLASLTSQLIQIVVIVIYLGHKIQADIQKGKAILRQNFTVASGDFPFGKKLQQIGKLINAWEWKMNASGFFDIGRPLMTTVVFLMVSYTVIVFQILIGEE